MITKDVALLEVKKLLLKNRRSVYLSSNVSNPFCDEELLHLILTVVDEIKKLGYRFSDEAIFRITKEEIIEFYNILLPSIAKETSREDFEPLYPGFPKQVIAMTNPELLKNQMELYKSLNYEEFAEKHPWYTNEEVNKKSPRRLIELGLFTKSDLYELFTNCLSTSGFLPHDDLELLYYMTIAFPEFEIPEIIPNKGNWAMMLELRNVDAKDINDILRLMAFKSGFTLEKTNLLIPMEVDPTSYVNKMPDRKTRKNIVEKISNIIKRKGIDNCVLDAKKYYNVWVIFGRRYHFGDYRKSYPDVVEFIHKLFTPEELKKLTSWNSKVHKLYHSLNENNFDSLVEFIIKRPGEYMRRFDSLIRRAITLNQDPDKLIDRILDIKVDTKLLLEVLNYYDKRMANAPRLIYSESGELMTTLKELPKLPEELVLYINYTLCMKIYQNIRDNNKEGSSMKNEKVYLDDALKRIPVPYNMKGSGNLVARGTKYEIPKGTNAIRLFLNWVDKDGTEDLDLHGIFVDKDNKCCFTGWNSSFVTDYCVFSGDVRHREGKCAEYIDINLQNARPRFKYVVINVHNFERRPFNTLDSWIGYEFLEEYAKELKPHYYPGDVDFLEKIEANFCSLAAFLIDLETNELSILNTDLKSIPSSSEDKALNIIKFFKSDPTFTVYNIAQAWYSAREAKFVENNEEATIIVNTETLKDYTAVLHMLTL